ncbi:NAD-dependent epimerase/dehydratase family protein [Propionicimonas sp.]|uniref:NAD-dependent epimerase/dehydratase family protein n=1 Tax=Propionicimonas sp. TaxID=1955623 RepID=UPI0039E3549B
MAVLVTGGTGFVAGWCIAGLLDRGHRVRTTVRDLGRSHGLLAQFPTASGRLEVVRADLTADEGWAEAVAGVDAVLHVASPMGGGIRPADPDDLILPARDGARRVIAAAVSAGVPRVVMTSSGAAATPPAGSAGEFDESLWTDPDQAGLDAYRRSKALAERAAWDEVAGSATTTLTTILPGAVFGPIRSPESRSSTQVVAQLIRPGAGVPRIGLQVVDVRDLADLHIAAMESPAAAGRRFLAVAGFIWMREIAELLRAEYGGGRGAVRELPDWLVRVAARLRPGMEELVPMLGRRYTYTTAAARSVLGWQPRPVRDTIIDTARSLVDAGLV